MIVAPLFGNMNMSENQPMILVVDDDAQIRKMLGIFLDSAELNVEECGSGQQAVRMCATLKPDLVILDLGLPDMNGRDVIAEIRQWSQVPIVVLSVHSHDDDIVAALNLGADDYVIKPFSVDVLMA